MIIVFLIRKAWSKIFDFQNLGKICAYKTFSRWVNISRISQKNELSVRNIIFIWHKKLFVKIFFINTLLLKLKIMKEYFNNKRSNIGTEISFVSRTENHSFITRDLIDTIKTTPLNNKAFQKTNSDTGSFLTAVRIKNASVWAVLRPFLSDFVNLSIEIFHRKTIEKSQGE